MGLKELHKLSNSFENTPLMPVLFVGHGNPMNAIEDNVFSKEMRSIGTKIPKPKAILMISAHWETKGTFVTGQETPPTIHDFGGFPQALFDVQYPAPGSKWLVEETQKTITSTAIDIDNTWGFDHGCWSVTKNMFPKADIPIIQLSLDYSQKAEYHYNLAKELFSLRKKGVLIIGSGNMVHNLGRMQLKNRDFNEAFGFDWALEANSLFKKYLLSNDHKPLINYTSLGSSVKLAVPTPEHYLPMLYAIALKKENEKISFFNDIAVAGAFTMTSMVMGNL